VWCGVWFLSERDIMHWSRMHSARWQCLYRDCILISPYTPCPTVRGLNRKSRSKLGRAASPPLTAENNYATKSQLLQRDASRLPPKLSLFPSTISTPSNTPISQTTSLTTPNHIQIQSAVLPQYTLRTDRQVGLATSLYQDSLTLYN